MKLLFLIAGPGKIPAGVRYDGPEDINKALNDQKDPTYRMNNMSERLPGDSSMMKNHTPRRFMTKKMIDYMTEVMRREIMAHGAGPVTWELVKVITKLAEVGAGFAKEGPEEAKIKRFEAPPQLIYRDEEGCRYKTKVEISHGKPNRYMKAAHDTYGKNSRWLQCPYINAEEANKQKAMFAQAGANRQGIATWGAWIGNGNITTDSMTSTMIYNYYGLASEGMIANEWARTGVSTSLLSVLNNEVAGQDFFRTYYNVDLLTNINSRFSTHSFYNSQEFSDLNIKVYVCQAKVKNYNAIWTDVAPFGGTTVPDFKVPRYSPAADSTSLTSPIKPTGAGFNWFDTAAAIPIHYTNNAGTGTTSSNVAVETSSVLGMTPQQSQAFKANWEVLDVLDNTIGPNDTWEVHLEQKFNKSHSVRSWYESFEVLELRDDEYERATYDNVLKQTQRGDIVLLTVFSGMPASNYVLNDNAKNTFPVDAGPSRIRHEVRHGINVSWPKPLQPLDMNDSDLLSPFFTQQGWNVVQQKTNYTDRESYPYASGEIKVATRYAISEDSSKTEAGT